MATDAPDVSVVVCTRNRADRLDVSLRAVLASLDDLADRALVGELVVVDNGSTDGTREVVDGLDDPRVRRVDEPVAGLGRARNAGVAAARGGAVLFTDDDVVVPRAWAAGLSAPLRAGEADLVFGGVAMAEHLERPWMTDHLRSRFFAHVPVPAAESPGAVGASMGATRDLLARLAFEPALGTARYPGGEDVFFSLLALESGARVRGVDGVVVRHEFDAGRLEPARLRRIAAGYGRVEAWASHHWLHADVRLPRSRALAETARARLALLRSRDPYDEAVLERIHRASFRREVAHLAGTPRRYPRRGLAPA